MRKFVLLLSVFMVLLLPLAACSGLIGRAESTGFYSTPKGMKVASEFTRLYVQNRCYADILATYPDIKGERKGERRTHYIFGRGTSQIWVGKKGSLPVSVFSKQGAPDLRYTPKDIRETAVRDEWRTDTAFIESYYLTFCPQEPELLDHEKNWTRPAIPGEMVDVHAIVFHKHMVDQPVTIKLNGVWVLHTKANSIGEAIFLLPAGTSGELKFVRSAKLHTFQIGKDWKPRQTRPAVKGEVVIMEPKQATPKGSW